MQQTENAQMIALMEHAVENLRDHTQETLQDCEQILEYGKLCFTVYSDIV